MPDGKLDVKTPQPEAAKTQAEKTAETPIEATVETPTKPPAFTLSQLQIGQPDSRGRMVRDVLVAMADFKVYRTGLGISVCFADDPERAAKQKDIYFRMAGIAEFNLLIHNLTSPLYRWREHHRVSRASDRADTPSAREEEINQQNAGRKPSLTLYERQLARCIAQAMLGQDKEAELSLNYIKEQLCARIRNRARVVHLSINLILTLLLSIAAYAFASADIKSVFGFDPTRELGLAMMMGAVGALFSTTVRLHLMEIDPTVTPSMHWIYGLQRVMVGALGALVIYFGFKSGLLNGLFQPNEAAAVSMKDFNPYWLSFVCVLAGFSERLVPNLLDSRSKQATRAAAAAKPVPAAKA